MKGQPVEIANDRQTIGVGLEVRNFVPLKNYALQERHLAKSGALRLCSRKREQVLALLGRYALRSQPGMRIASNGRSS